MDQAENLRTIIKKQNQKDIENARIIAVTSGKGGVGKSSFSINIAIQLAHMGKKVIVLDADFGLANIEVMLGIIPKANLSDLMFKGKELKDIILDGPDGVRFISGGSGVSKLSDLNTDQIKSVLNKMSQLEELADVIIIDTGAGMASSVMEFLVASPEIVIVTTPEPTSITDSYALLKGLTMYDGFNPQKTRIRIVTNKVTSPNEGRLLFEKLSMVLKQFLNLDVEFLGIVMSDATISKAVMKQTPVSIMYPDSESSHNFYNIAKTLETDQDPVMLRENGVRKFFRKILSKNK